MIPAAQLPSEISSIAHQKLSRNLWLSTSSNRPHSQSENRCFLLYVATNKVKWIFRGENAKKIQDKSLDETKYRQHLRRWSFGAFRYRYIDSSSEITFASICCVWAEKCDLFGDLHGDAKKIWKQLELSFSLETSADIMTESKYEEQKQIWIR